MSELGELWVSLDDGATWTMADSNVVNNGKTSLNTDVFEDTPFARVRLLFRDDEGFIHRREDSGPFAIDNEGNGAPLVRITKLPYVGDDALKDDHFELSFIVGDPEGQDLDVSIRFSHDGGAHFEPVATLTMPSADTLQRVDIDLLALPNTRQGVFQVLASDGNLSSEDRTLAKPIPTATRPDELPRAIRVVTNYPNPFGRATTIQYDSRTTGRRRPDSLRCDRPTDRKARQGLQASWHAARDVDT